MDVESLDFCMWTFNAWIKQVGVHQVFIQLCWHRNIGIEEQDILFIANCIGLQMLHKDQCQNFKDYCLYCCSPCSHPWGPPTTALFSLTIQHLSRRVRFHENQKKSFSSVLFKILYSPHQLVFFSIWQPQLFITHTLKWININLIIFNSDSNLLYVVPYVRITFSVH